LHNYSNNKTTIMKKSISLFLLLFATLMGVKAQDVKITGKVTEAGNNTPVESASISLKGKSKGVSTNANGDFSISVPQGATLLISSVGYQSREIAASAEMNISLTKDANNLADVVVVGYGTQKRGNVTSAVTTIKGVELTKRPLASTSMTLQGLAPGVVVQQGSGQPGADGGRITIRGYGSITGSDLPLIIADGVEGVSLNDIDPNAIESISILKDAASTAVYGVRGTNGVILIKTKRAVAGKTSIAFNSFVSKQTPTNFPNLLSSIDHMLLQNEADLNAAPLAAPTYTQAQIDLYKNNAPNNLSVFNTDWKDLIFQNNGMMQNHNLIISGGSEKVAFLASGTVLDQQGLVVNNRFKKYDLRLNGDVNFTSKIKFTTDLFYTKAVNVRPAGMSVNEIIQRGISMARIFPGKFGERQYGDAGQSNQINPVGAAEASGISRAETPTLSLRFALSAEVFKNFIINASYNNRTSYTESYTARGTYNSFNPNPVTGTYIFNKVIGDSALSYTNNRLNTNQYNVSGNYSFNVRKNHEFKTQVGFQGLDNTLSSIGASRQGLQDPNRPYLNLATSSVQPSVSGSITDYALAGFFSRINYGYKDKYLLEFTGRYDGSSRFSQLADAQWGTFYGVSTGWVITKEKFMDKIPVINYAKLRLSYGEIGNQEVGDNYPFAATLNGGTAYYFNNVLTRGTSLNGIPNETISWETSTQKNIGIDLILLKNKLSITFDKYQKKINDLIFDDATPTSLGFLGAASPSNRAAMVNNGWEFSSTYKSNIRKINYSVTANISDVKNKILATGGRDIVAGNKVSRVGNSIYSYNVYRTNGLYQKGDNFNSPYDGTRTGKVGPGDVKFVDIDGNDTLNAKDRVLLGNNFPRYDYSLNFNADYAGFDVNVFLFGVGKRDNQISGIAIEPFNGGNWFASGLESALDRWTPENTNSKYPRLYKGGNGNYTTGSDFFIRDGSFMRIKQITLGYSLPKKWLNRIKVQQLRFYVNTVNPFTFSNYDSGFDPEITDTNGSFFPIMKTTTIGVNLKF
jgi:TonB-linked SusC/RagA family outer membrane protein